MSLIVMKDELNQNPRSDNLIVAAARRKLTIKLFWEKKTRDL